MFTLTNSPLFRVTPIWHFVLRAAVQPGDCSTPDTEVDCVREKNLFEQLQDLLSLKTNFRVLTVHRTEAIEICFHHRNIPTDITSDPDGNDRVLPQHSAYFYLLTVW